MSSASRTADVGPGSLASGRPGTQKKGKIQCPHLKITKRTYTTLKTSLIYICWMDSFLSSVETAEQFGILIHYPTLDHVTIPRTFFFGWVSASHSLLFACARTPRHKGSHTVHRAIERSQRTIPAVSKAIILG